MGLNVAQGRCGAVNLSGLKLASLLAWPRAIHEGRGQAVFVVEPETTDRQIEALAQIVTGRLGGLPWSILGPTYEVAGLVKARITIEGQGRRSRFIAEGVGEGRGDTLRNPVTGEDHLVNVDLPQGFIWKRGEVGRGSFRAEAAGLSVAADHSNWIYYAYDWSNTA